MLFTDRCSRILALAAMSLASASMIACSGGGGSNSDSGKAAPAPAPAPNQNPGQNPVATGNSELTKNFWCTNTQDNNGGNHQLRVELFDGGKVGLSIFALSDAGRGALENHADGTYTITSSNINLTINNQSATHVIRLDPQSQTGAPQLHIDSGVFDPCN